MKESEIHGLWVTEWAIIEELLFLCNIHSGGGLVHALGLNWYPGVNWSTTTRCWCSLIKYFNIFVLSNISDPSIIVYLLHIHGYYYYFYSKYYADLSWLCSVGTCIVSILILD